MKKPQYQYPHIRPRTQAIKDIWQKEAVEQFKKKQPSSLTLQLRVSFAYVTGFVEAMLIHKWYALFLTLFISIAFFYLWKQISVAWGIPAEKIGGKS